MGNPWIPVFEQSAEDMKRALHRVLTTSGGALAFGPDFGTNLKELIDKTEIVGVVTV